MRLWSTAALAAELLSAALSASAADDRFNFVLRVWVRYERAQAVQSELVAAVDTGLREAGIAIPVPAGMVAAGSPAGATR